MLGIMNQYGANQKQIAQIKKPFQVIMENSNSTSDEDAYILKEFEDETREKLLDSVTLSVSYVVDLIEERERYEEKMEQVRRNEKAVAAYFREMTAID